MNPIRSILVPLASCVLAASGNAQGMLANTMTADNPQELMASVENFESAVLAIPQHRPEFMSVTVPINGQPATIDLRRVSLFKQNAEILVYGENGHVEQIPVPTPNTYRGEIRGMRGSVVTGGIKKHGLHALVSDGDGVSWSLEPLDQAGTHMVYRSDDREWTPGSCDEPFDWDLDDAGDAGQGGQHGHVAARGSATAVAELALDADYEYYQWNGSSVGETIDEMALVINNVNEAYERDTGISHVLTRVIVRTSASDPYTSAQGIHVNGEQVFEWGNFQTDAAYDLVHLFTNKNVFSSTSGLVLAGRAFDIGVVCDRLRAFAFSEARSNDRLQALLVAHEIGHLWNGRHCNNKVCIGVGECVTMCSSLGACDDDDVRFGSCSASRIITHRDSRECLDGGTTDTQWVQWRSCGAFCSESGDFTSPHNTVAEAVNETASGGTVMIKAGIAAAAQGDETFPVIIDKSMTIRSFDGDAVIGQ